MGYNSLENSRVIQVLIRLDIGRLVMNIIDQFTAIVDPSTTLGAFIISIAASLVVGFFTGKKVANIQKGKNVKGDMIQNSKVKKG